eukprot:scaffold2986_cov249-Pinguiococcus_pyrenoidosus.AAC.9
MSRQPWNREALGFSFHAVGTKASHELDQTYRLCESSEWERSRMRQACFESRPSRARNRHTLAPTLER